MGSYTRIAGAGTGAVLLALWLGVSTEGAGGAAQLQQAPNVTTDTRLTCHDQTTETRLQKHHGECQSCHTGGNAHAVAPEKGNIGRPAATQCLGCHGATMQRTWSFGQHAKGEVACSSCHAIHASRTVTTLEGRGRKVDRVSAKCASCHAGVMARFRMPSHHPVTEGVMSCTNCHDPHSGNQTTVRNEVELCGSCHQAQRTPKPLVHPPVAEACSTCHNPHGTPNRKLLVMAQPTLCIQCHSVADNRHAVGAVAGGPLGGAPLRKCTNCHKAIHGGQLDAHLRY